MDKKEILGSEIKQIIQQKDKATKTEESRAKLTNSRKVRSQWREAEKIHRPKHNKIR